VTRASASRTCSNGNTAPDLGPQLAGIDQAAQLLQPRPVDANDSPVMPRSSWAGVLLQDQEDRPAAGAVQQQVHAAGNGGTHLLGPADGVVVEDLAGAQALQVVTVGRAGHAPGTDPDGRRDLHGGAAHAPRGGGDEHGLSGLQPPRSARPS
jgi:hypothetical protein